MKERSLIQTPVNVPRLTLALACTTVLIFTGCRAHNAATESTSSGTASAPAPTAAPIDPATAGSITGIIHFKGTAPARIPIDMSMDPACSLAGENLTEQYIVNKGSLANVYVYIKVGLPASAAPTGAAPVKVDQKGCRFIPHVAAVQQGGDVSFINSDPTMHNIHTVTLGDNPALDVSQGPGAEPQVRRMNSPETMIALRCNNHPWMNAFLNVAPNPFFTVSGPDGSFTITGLPPGTYTLAAVHEKLGEQDTQITVPPHGKATAAFNYAMQ